MIKERELAKRETNRTFRQWVPMSRALGIKKQEWGPDGNPLWGYPCFPSIHLHQTKWEGERESRTSSGDWNLKGGEVGRLYGMEDWALGRQRRDLWELQRVSQPFRGSKQGCPRPPATGANTSQDFYTTLRTSLGLRSAFPGTVTVCMSPPYQRLSTYCAQGTKPGRPGPPEQLII